MFYAGYTPRGWRRGEYVHVELPTSTSHGHIERKTPRRSVVLEVREPTYRVHFTAGDMRNVRTWLLWWFEGDEMERDKIRRYMPVGVR